MCTIQEFCGCCYLSTGVVFVCCFYLVFFVITYNTDPIPVWASTVNGRYDLEDYRWYYIVAVAVTLLALLGVFTKKRILLLPLIWFDVIRSVFTAVVFAAHFDRSLIKNTSYDGVVFIVAALQLYVIILEISFFQELQKTRYGNGIVINRPTDASVCRPTAPCAVEIPPEQHHFINPTPVVPHEYTIQDPYYQPYMQVCPQASLAQQSNILDNSATQFSTPPFPHGAPPPYPHVQSHTPRENPPPYAP